MSMRFPDLRVLLVPAAFAFASTQPLLASADEQNVHQEFAATPDVSVTIANVEGRIQVRPSDGNRVDILAVKSSKYAEALANISVDIAHSGDPAAAVSIKTRYHENGRHSGRVDYDLTVPRHARLKITNVSGNIVADGFAGDITASDISGDVSAEGTDGSLKIHTVNGSISASLTRMNRRRVASLHTVNGSVRLAVPRDSGAEIKARSISGRFQSDFPLNIRSQLVGLSVSDRIGDGSGSIDLESIDGSLSLRASR